MKKLQRFNGALIGGMPSSGSTLLSVILDSHSELLSGPETTLFAHAVLWDAEKLNAKNAWDAWVSQNDVPGMLQWSLVDENNLGYYAQTQNSMINIAEFTPNLYVFGDEFFRKKMAADNKKIWVEKTPQNIYSANNYLRNNLLAKFIICIRDPRAVIESLVRRGRSDEVACRICALELNIIYYLLTDIAINPRIKLIRYEELVSEPLRITSDTCTFLGVADEAETMLTRKGSDRNKRDSSILPNEHTAACSWKFLPFDEIKNAGIIRWESALSAGQYDTFLHTRVNPEIFSKFLKGMELRNPVPLSTSDLLDYFGYSYRQKYEESKSTLDNFYFSNAYFHSDQDDHKLLKQNKKESSERLYKVRIRLGRIVSRISSRLNYLVSLLLKFPRKVIRMTFYFLMRLLGFNGSTLLRLSRSFLRKLKTRVKQIAIKLSGSLRSVKPSYNAKYKWNKPTDDGSGFDLIVVIAFSGRHNVLKAVINEIFRIKKKELRVGVVLSCTEDIDVKFAQELRQKWGSLGFACCDNNPLGNKWHIAVECARKLKPNAIMITGSDDLVTSDYIINNYKILIADPFDTLGMIGPRAWYVLSTDYVNGSALWKVAYKIDHHKMPLGAGRMYAKTYLDKVKWCIFDRSLGALLDDKGYHEMLLNGYFVYCPTFDDGAVVSIKGPWKAMNSMKAILSADSIVATKVHGEEKEVLLEKIADSMELIDNRNIGDQSSGNTTVVVPPNNQVRRSKSATVL